MQIIEDVYAEDLTMLDSLIETGVMSDEEYEETVKSTYQLIY